MNQLPTSKYVYNETQKIPTLHNVNSNNVDIINKITLMGNCIKNGSVHQGTEIQYIKNNQKVLESQIQKLFELCENIGKSVTEVKDKLSQYDIDEGDDESNHGESENEMGDYTDNTETEQQPTEIIDNSIEDIKTNPNKNHFMNIANIDYSSSIVAEPETSSDKDEVKEYVEEVEEVEEIKPKRKYNRKKK
jgi:hypothetical protein